MEWNVKNALSRDVEREHLNRILKDIRRTIDGMQRSVEQPRQPSQPAPIRVAPSTPSTFTLTLTGDVTGSATVGGTNSVIVTTLDPSLVGVGEAPLDSNFYWRAGGEWQAVPRTLSELAYLDVNGLVAHDPDEGWLSGEAPEDDKLYARRNGEWVEVESTGGGRVLPVVTGEIINGQPQFVYLDDGSLVYTEI